MLMIPAARDLYAAISTRWQHLDGWLASIEASRAARVQGSIGLFRSAWQNVDRGLLSNSDDLLQALADLQSAEALAASQGYVMTRYAGGTAIGGTDAADAEAKAQAMKNDISNPANTTPPDPLEHPLDAAERAAADLVQNAKDSLPKMPDESWCQVIGLPDAICDKHGLKAPGLGDVPIWMWGFGIGGAATFGLIVYAAYRASKVAAPLAVAYYAPQALPAYQAFAAGNKTEAKDHVLKAVAEEGAKKRAEADFEVPSGWSPMTVGDPSGTAKTLVMPAMRTKVSAT